MTDQHINMQKFMDSLTSRCPTLFNATNSKFLAKVRSDMIEERLGLELATRVANALQIELQHINEDDDLVSQASGEYAAYAGKVFDRLTSLNMHKQISDEMIKKYFAHTVITF